MRPWLVLVLILIVPSCLRASTIGEPGNLLVGLADGGVVEFDGTTGDTLGYFLTAQLNDFAFKGTVLYATDPSDQIVAYDASSGALLSVLAGPSLVTNPGRIRLAPDGSLVFLNQLAGTLTLDHISSTGAFLGSISTLAVNDFVFGPNGNIYATTPHDELVEIDTSTGIVLEVLTATLSNPGPLLFLQDGSIVVRDAGGLQRFTQQGSPLGVFSPLAFNDIALGTDGHLYGSAATDEILILNGSTGELLSTFASTGANPGHLQFRPVPQPDTALLLGMGLALLAMSQRAGFER